MLFRYVFVDFKNYMLFFIYFIEHIFVFSIACVLILCYIDFIEHSFCFLITI